MHRPVVSSAIPIEHTVKYVVALQQQIPRQKEPTRIGLRFPHLLIRTSAQNVRSLIEFFLESRPAGVHSYAWSRYSSMALIKSNSPVSLNEGLLTELRPALVRYFRRKSGDAAEAEDLAQDVLVRTLGQTLRNSAAEARGFIFRIAANRWRDRLRRNLSHGVEISLEGEEFHELPGEYRTPERMLSGEQELYQVRKALLALDVRTRNVFLLVRLEHMKIATVAQTLGISRQAVNRLLAKAIAHIRTLEEVKQ